MALWSGAWAAGRGAGAALLEDVRGRKSLGGGVRIHPENAGMRSRHGVQYVAKCVACAALTLTVRQ